MDPQIRIVSKRHIVKTITLNDVIIARAVIYTDKIVNRATVEEKEILKRRVTHQCVIEEPVKITGHVVFSIFSRNSEAEAIL